MIHIFLTKQPISAAPPRYDRLRSAWGSYKGAKGVGCLAVRLFALGIEAIPRNDDDDAGGGGVRSLAESPTAKPNAQTQNTQNVNEINRTN